MASLGVCQISRNVCCRICKLQLQLSVLQSSYFEKLMELLVSCASEIGLQQLQPVLKHWANRNRFESPSYETSDQKFCKGFENYAAAAAAAVKKNCKLFECPGKCSRLVGPSEFHSCIIHAPVQFCWRTGTSKQHLQ